MSLLDSVSDAIKTKINELDKQVEAEQAEARRKMAEAENEQARADIQPEVKKNVEQLQSQMADAKQQLDEAMAAGEDRLKEIRDSFTTS